MNYNFEIELIRLIVEFLFGNTIKLNGNTEALKFRLVCRKFKEEIDRLAHLLIIFPIKERRKHKNYRLPSGIPSISVITKHCLDKITKEDWEDLFGDELSNLESSLSSVRYLHVSAGIVEYLPKFNCLNSISWEVGNGCYNLLDKIPHEKLKIIGYTYLFHGSIAHLTRLSEIEITDIFFDYRLISEHLPLTISKMTIVMCRNKVDVIDLSKFTSLKYLEIRTDFDGRLIMELILPPSINELHSEVKIEKINLHECKRLGVLELI